MGSQLYGLRDLHSNDAIYRRGDYKSYGSIGIEKDIAAALSGIYIFLQSTGSAVVICQQDGVYDFALILHSDRVGQRIVDSYDYVVLTLA